ncbi:hypothetical protein [Streptomyces yangpuensis]|uniref:hypothetical protein n=1 Tax=Streptomyces yangpuensis TaxID=1648182 RepID=UPI003662B36C
MTHTTGREGGEEHPLSPTAKFGVIVTVVASIAGLVTTGVATLFSALVAHDQLDQSDRVAEEKRRAQAARVSYWVDLQSDGTPRLHLMNRSPDPISEVNMFFSVELADPPPDWSGRISFPVTMQSMPPCSDMTLTLNDMKYKVRGGKEDAQWFFPGEDPPSENGWLDFAGKRALIFPGFVDFGDRDGVTWRRAGGLLTRTPPGAHPKVRSWGVVRPASLLPLKSCADERA